jgi:protein-S-isoprenylcysteine O-methyltransferase Ste14
MNIRKLIAVYLVIQGIATALWWCVLFAVPAAAEWFHPDHWPRADHWPRESLLGFWLSDSILLVAGSFFTAAAVLTDKPWASIAIWTLAAATWYPSLYCLGVSFMTDQAWIASALMTCMAGITLSMATIYGHSGQTPAMFRSAPMTKRAAASWTAAQIIIFWFTFLWILPKGIFELEQRLGITDVTRFTPNHLIAPILFTLASVLGIAAAHAMNCTGKGTPLPTANAPNLVVTGPYRYVRNPMALAGILQGLCTGWFLGSYAVLTYALLGAVAWHIFVRLTEERELAKRFGDEYTQYKSTVPLWVPRLF